MFEDFNYCFNKFKVNKYFKTKESEEIKKKYGERYGLKIKSDSLGNVTMIYSGLHHSVVKYVFETYFVKEFKDKYTNQQFEIFKKKLGKITNYYRLNLLLGAYFYNIKIGTDSEGRKSILNSKDVKIWSLRIEIARKMTEFGMKGKKDILDIFSIDEFYEKFPIKIS